MSTVYQKRGVSASKQDVHNAIKNIDKGLFPGAFCKIIEDASDSEYCCLMHADGAGTKSSLAYMYYKETGDLSVFTGIAQDSLIMNIDDLICVGAGASKEDVFVVSNTIGRNAHRVPGEVIKTIIEGYEIIAQTLREGGLNVVLSGGETADVGDLVSTLIADSTVFTRLKKSNVIDCSNIKPGCVIVGLSSSGTATYETGYNAGMGSNGLTAARHLMFSHTYASKYPETYSSTLSDDLVYCGKYALTDVLPGTDITAGKAVLSPTRTYAPIIRQVLSEGRDGIYGIIHCTGGAQVKCKGFGSGIRYVKDDLFDIPPLFSELIKSDISLREAYNIFNMGHRMEICCDEARAGSIISVSRSFGVDAKIIGHTEKASGASNELVLTACGETFEY